jgi:hypothetical protein
MRCSPRYSPHDCGRPNQSSSRCSTSGLRPGTRNRATLRLRSGTHSPLPTSSAPRRLLRVDVFRYLMRGEIRTVRDWLDALPPDVLQADPALSTAFGWSLVLAGESEGVLDRVAAAERALATDPDAFDRMAVPSQLEALQARVAEMGGDLDASLVHTRAALDSIPGDVDRELGDRPGLRAQPELADAPGALDVAYARQVPVPCIAGSRVMVSVGTTVVDPVLVITNT